MTFDHHPSKKLYPSRAANPFLRWLTRIPDSLPASTQRRANLLAWLLLFILLLSLVTALVVFLNNPSGSQRRSVYGLLISGFLILISISFVLNRRGYYNWAAGITISLAFLAPWGSLLLDPMILKGDFVPLNYVLLPILLSSILLSSKFTILYTLLQMTGLFLVAFFTAAEEMINWPSLMVFVFFASVFSIIHNTIRDRDLAQIDLQTALLKANEISLREQSIRDPLTTLFNRRYLTETLEREIRRAERDRSPVGMIMMDIDHFKDFNDTHGHPAGDQLLHELGLLLKSHIREADIACRYGGEEFVLLMPGAPFEITCLRAQQLIDKVRNMHFAYQGIAMESITISAGVASYPQHGHTGQEVLEAADVALYQAKAAGRNQMVSAALIVDGQV